MAELIVALDVSSMAEAEAMVDRLSRTVSFYKIGLELFSAAGPEVVARVKRRDTRVFLDLKLHDIPRTVARAVKACAGLGVDLLTIHSSGGRAMIRAAADAAAECGPSAPRILADLGIGRSMAAQVEVLGSLAVSAGAHGIVCSPQEVASMRRRLGPAALLVTPGVRPTGAAKGDQKRVATPAQAVADGATHLVVGRPILEAPDPRAAAERLLAEMAGS